jgi:hypothetical protein
VARSWRRLHNGELHNLYASSNTIRVINTMTIGWDMQHVWEDKKLVRKPERKTSLRRPRCRWEVSIRMNLWKTGWKSVNWIWFRIGTCGGLL